MAPYFFISIYISFSFCVLYNKKIFLPLSLCIHVACENKQTESKKKRNKTEREKKKTFGINRENVYKNEQNGTNTRIQPMRQNKENDRQRRNKKNEDNEDVVGIEIQIDCTSTGLGFFFCLFKE
jgi:hypothetical protein